MQNKPKNMILLVIIIILLVIGLAYVLIDNSKYKEIFKLEQNSLQEDKEAFIPENDYIENLKGKIVLNGKETIFSRQECRIDSTSGGPIKYILDIKLIDESKNNFNRVGFSIQDFQNSKSNLLKTGIHVATGQHWDDFSNGYSESTYTINGIKSDEMEIVLNKVGKATEVKGISDGLLPMEGYINVKKMIKQDCPDKMWTGEKYINKGDPNYICNFENQYLESQKIYFKCEATDANKLLEELNL